MKSCQKILAALGIFFWVLLSPAQTPAKTELSSEQCEALKLSISQKIKDSTRCLADSDCAIGSFDCPFGCENIVRADQMKTIQQLNGEYSASCKRCTYDCYAPPAEVGCVNRQCAKLNAAEIGRRIGPLNRTECKAEERNVKRILRNLNTCESDGDCVDAGMACPFGCRNPVGRKNLARAQAYISRYSSTCGPNCEYKCARPKVFRCVEKTCVSAD